MPRTRAPVDSAAGGAEVLAPHRASRMLHPRGVRRARPTHIHDLLTRYGLDLVAGERDVFVYDVEVLVRAWCRGPVPAPLPDLSADDIVRLRRPGSVAFLDWSGEGAAFPPAAFRNLLDWCARTDVPPAHLVVVDADPAGKAAALASLGAAEPGLRFAFGFAYLDRVLGAAARLPGPDVAAALAARKGRRILSLNNAPRLHRILLAAQILGRDPASLVSLGGAKKAADGPAAATNRMFSPDALAAGLAPFRADGFARHADLVAGFDLAATAAKATLPAPTGPKVLAFDVPLYARTLVSAVGETEMTDGSLSRITEKTVKPALFGHPFLVAGNPDALRLVRRLGFETFPALFDEAYDAIADPVARLAAVLDEVARLAAEPVSALADRVAGVRRELTHNSDHGLRALRLRYGAFMARQLAALLAGGPGVRQPGDIGPFA